MPGLFFVAANMAKGNDGNYLQHGIEIEAALRLAKTDPDGRLHIALAHGMAPFESFEARKAAQAHRRLDDALMASGRPSRPGEPAIVTAYRKTGASEARYPNSAELLRSIVGTDKLSGGITEVDPEKCSRLARAWADSRVVPRCSSWRDQVDAGGVLACPEDLQVPWLISMDPMTYTEGSEANDDKLHRFDIDRLSDWLARYVESRRPGLAALFVYSVRPDGQLDFWRFVHDLQKRTGTRTYTYWLPHQGGNRNLAGLLYAGTEFLSSTLLGVNARV